MGGFYIRNSITSSFGIDGHEIFVSSFYWGIINI